MSLPKPLLDAHGGGVFFLHGADEHRKAAAAKELVERYADPATADFNVDRIDGADATVERLASVIATPPMLAEWRVVHLRDAEEVASSPKARKLLLETARKPPPGLALIVQATVPRRSRARFYTDLARIATSSEFRPVPEYEVPDWLVSWASEELGAELRLDAARALAASVGTELGVLTQELRKLAEMAGVGTAVDLEVVRRGGMRLARQDRWAWFDLVGGREIGKAVRALPTLIDQGETAVGLVIGLSVQMLRVGIAVEGGKQALERALPPYQRFLSGRIAGQARRWRREELAAALLGLRRLDRLLKASSLPGDLLIEEWLLGLAARSRPRRGAVA
ncbi:MAG: DNA polymerase III subunit delta [Gemmatimonadetes bacterium]|nr:DNA polymerase III subunit delta [Gemmatimonadota bacterium]